MLLKLFDLNSMLFASSGGFMSNIITLILITVLYLFGLTIMWPYLDLFLIVMVMLETAMSGGRWTAFGGGRDRD